MIKTCALSEAYDLIDLNTFLPTARYVMGKLGGMDNIDQIKKIFPGFDGTVIVDGTHVEACRPQDKEERKAAYSGKKKTTAYIYVNPTGSFPIFASSLSPYVRHLSS